LHVAMTSSKTFTPQWRGGVCRCRTPDRYLLAFLFQTVSLTAGPCDGVGVSSWLATVVTLIGESIPSCVIPQLVCNDSLIQQQQSAPASPCMPWLGHESCAKARTRQCRHTLAAVRKQWHLTHTHSLTDTHTHTLTINRGAAPVSHTHSLTLAQHHACTGCSSSKPHCGTHTHVRTRTRARMHARTHTRTERVCVCGGLSRPMSHTACTHMMYIYMVYGHRPTWQSHTCTAAHESTSRCHQLAIPRVRTSSAFASFIPPSNQLQALQSVVQEGLPALLCWKHCAVHT
jgi:hypothetical protein